MKNLAFATIKELQDLIARKELSPREVVEYCVRRFEAFDPELKSALEIFDIDSIEKFYASQGKLTGIPGLIKDNIAMESRRMTCASKILEGFTSVGDATVINRLKQAGAPLIGRANMDEFAMGSSTETSAYQKTRNPWDTSRVPGGSSGGSAAAVAAGLVPWALGTETGGSVRQPAAFCGIMGLKPTYGLISRYGVVAYGSSLDQVGIFTRSAYDCAAVLSEIAGYDINDFSSIPVEKVDYTLELERGIEKGLRIGVVDNAINAQGMDQEVVSAVNESIRELEKAGAIIKRVSLPILDYSAATYFIISRAEAASNLARFDGVRYGARAKSHNLSELYKKSRHDGFGPEVRARIMIGNYVLSAGHAGAFYEKAQNVRRAIRASFADAFKEVDLLVMPTHPAPAFTFGAFDVDKLQMDLQDYFTCPANLAGIPAISVPCGMTSNKLPIGMQLVGPHLSESLLLRVAHAYERMTGWHLMHPQGY